jgi:aspartyl-tRNA(Asn)/glutamyl-tRNA(Gln) amidotransferase subunit C
MSLTIAEIEKIAQLAQLALTETEKIEHAGQISRTLELMTPMQQIATQNITISATTTQQYIRPDIVTSQNDRDLLQELAPCVKMGLYLVPQVIEEA